MIPKRCNGTLVFIPVSDDIQKALRNKKILDWYNDLPLIGGYGIISRSSVIVGYAKVLQCPVCEVTFDAPDEEMFDFLYRNFHHSIDGA